jgi:hypothetical protein
MMSQLPWRARPTHRKEYPLQHLAVMGIRWVERKDMVLVVVLSKVQQNCGALKDVEIVTRTIGYRRDAAVGVELDVPRLFLHIVRKFHLE